MNSSDPRALPLAVNNVTLTFGGIVALTDVSFTASPGAVHAVIGPNGAGKSSTFNVISGIYRATSGSVTYGTEVISESSPSRIARLGIGRTFQNIALTPSDTVLENVMVGRHRLTRTGYLSAALGLPKARQEERKHTARVIDIADFVGIGPLLARRAGTLSYGQRKMVELARALATEPDVLLLDEPAAGLPTHEKVGMARLVRSVATCLGTTVLIVEHDMPLVMSVADQITVLDFGRVIADGSPIDIQNDPAVIAAYLGQAEPDQPARAAGTRDGA